MRVTETVACTCIGHSLANRFGEAAFPSDRCRLGFHTRWSRVFGKVGRKFGSRDLLPEFSSVKQSVVTDYCSSPNKTKQFIALAN